jgi:hypothetical protein
MDLPNPTSFTQSPSKKDFLSQLKKAGRKVITMNNLAGVQDVVYQSLGYLEDNMTIEAQKKTIVAPFIGDKGSEVKTAKELLYGARSKALAKVISVEHLTEKSMVAAADGIYLGDSLGNMCAYNHITGKYKSWKIDLAVSELHLFGDLLVVSAGSTTARCLTMNIAGFLESASRYPKTANSYNAGSGCQGLDVVS